MQPTPRSPHAARMLPRIALCLGAAVLVSLALTAFSSLAPDSEAAADHTEIPPEGDWRLVFEDNFDWFNESNWTTEFGPYGWSAGTAHCYRSDNVSVDDGFLVLTARDDNPDCGRHGGRDYSSGMLRSKGLQEWRYGYVEIRAQMPVGKGLWPAIWLSPGYNVHGSWPASGEIDIAETIGSRPDELWGTIHYLGDDGRQMNDGSSYHEPYSFHTYGVEWSEGRIVWYLDGVEYHRAEYWPPPPGASFPAPFDRYFYLKLNLAVGGDWPGYPDDTTPFPAKMVIDWVRVHQR